MRVLYLAAVFSLVLVLFGGSAVAQNNTTTSNVVSVHTPEPPVFVRIFPNPTHNNGYEEWVQAGDLIRDNKDIDEAITPEATLTLKRRIMADPSVIQALHLLRAGLQKPITSPRTEFDENTLLPEFALFRKLARLLKIEQYVYFADGRVSSAIESLRVGLAFGYRIQTDCLISGLVGVAVDAIVLNEFAQHFDQLSVLQCDQVLRVVDESLKADNPAPRLLALEKSYVIKDMDKYRSDATAFLDHLKQMTPDDDAEPNPDLHNIQDYFTNHPKELTGVIEEVKARMNAHYEQMLTNARLPLAERKTFVRDHSQTPAAQLFRLLAVEPTRVLDRYSADLAKFRQLGVHVLIRRYRWEHNALPDALADLHADDLVADPFTGEQIVYTRDGNKYALYSQGPQKRDDDGNTITGQRVPVKLVP